MTYEYITLDLGDLSELNRLSRDGWRVVHLDPPSTGFGYRWALLERELESILKNTPATPS